MASRLSADAALLHIKLLAANAGVLYHVLLESGVIGAWYQPPRMGVDGTRALAPSISLPEGSHIFLMASPSPPSLPFSNCIP